MADSDSSDGTVFSPRVLAEDLEDLVDRTDASLDAFRTMGMVPDTEKRLHRYYRVQSIAKMLSCSRTKVDYAMAALNLEVHRNSDNNRVLGLTLEEVNQIRHHLGELPGRQDDEECVRVAVQSFKGGVAKSVTTVYLAQSLAEKGYRVLVIDCDPQASATSSFGFIPDATFNEENTLAPYLRGEQQSLQYAIIETYFAGIHLVPSCLDLMDVDFALFDAVAKGTDDGRQSFYHRISKAIGTVEADYDVVILDSSPNLSMMSINIMIAANAVIIPAPPMLYDFSSTAQYIKMMRQVMEVVAPDKWYYFVKVLASKVDRSKPKQIEFLEVMADNYSKFMLKSPLYMATAIPDSAARFQTVIDQQKPDRRVKQMLDNLFNEIEDEIRKVWPSHHEALRMKGVLRG